MIRIALCDDSVAFLNQLNTLIEEWASPLARFLAVERFENGDELLAAHAKNPFDILFLDVVMPILNGIETASELRQEDKTLKIVFLTSSPEYAVDSYRVKASNFLLKPLDPAAFYACLAELVQELRGTEAYLIAKGASYTHRLPLSEIEYVESQSKHNVIYTTSGKTVESIDPLYAYENTLTLEEGFFKCHRSYIVNIHQINSYSQTEIVMRSGCRIPIARSHQKTFGDVYFSVIFKKAEDEI